MEKAQIISTLNRKNLQQLKQLKNRNKLESFHLIRTIAFLKSRGLLINQDSQYFILFSFKKFLFLLKIEYHVPNC
jgi:hypothetical protein